MNDKVISQGGKEWHHAAMQHAIFDKIEEEDKILSLKIEDIRETTAATMNELIGLVALQENITKDGLQELVLNKWGSLPEKHLVEPLEDSVMQSLLSNCNALTTLKMTEMSDLNDDVRMCLAKKAASILSTNSNIAQLDF